MLHSFDDLRLTTYGLLLFTLAIAFTGCEGFGNSLLMANPSVARWAAVSEKEAMKYPVAERYRWAYARHGIEASDVKRGIRWRNTLKVRNASKRAVRFLEIMETLLDAEADRRAAREIIETTRALGEALSGGRWFRAGMDAAEALHRDVETRLAPDRIALGEERPRTAPASEVTKAPPMKGTWTVAAKRVVVEESAGGVRKRFLLVLEDGRGGKEEKEVAAEAFERTSVGATWA
ncbi:MAG: hypothetical protein ACYS47_10335, partial [Planctomycetota bacterium]